MTKRIFWPILMVVMALGMAFAPTVKAQAAWWDEPDWPEVQEKAQQIAAQARALQAQAQTIQEAANTLAGLNPEWSDTASQIIALAAQVEQDAAAIAVTAEDINQRIDNSEATTLRLSDDIGRMADRIGEMADRILWTELQIGVMADRIVESEYLINTGAQQSADQVQETLALLMNGLQQSQTLTQTIAALNAEILNQVR